MNLICEWSRRAALSAASCALFSVPLLLTGCGDDGPSRYHLSGEVTHGADPVPAGSISLIPDTSQGNSGPAASTEIRDGRFDTRWSGTGHVGGPHVVRVTGLDGQADDEFFPRGLPMFPDYELRLDLPAEEATQDIQVPADWTMPAQPPTLDHGP
jgi:hypothetical protein